VRRAGPVGGQVVVGEVGGHGGWLFWRRLADGLEGQGGEVYGDWVGVVVVVGGGGGDVVVGWACWLFLV